MLWIYLQQSRHSKNNAIMPIMRDKLNRGIALYCSGDRMKQILYIATGIAIGLMLVILPGYARAESRGIEGRDCPFSCRSEGIPKKYCRDWRKGNTCYVEDLRPHKPQRYHRYPNVQKSHTSHHRPPVRYSCNNLRTRNMIYPKVKIHKVHPTDKNDRFLVSGTIAGTCLTEAGYYERGRERQGLPVTTTDQSVRLPFTVYVRSNKRPEIFVKNIKGGIDRISLLEYLPARYDDHTHDHHEHGTSCNYPHYPSQQESGSYYKPTKATSVQIL